MAIKLLELENGTEIWKVQIAELKEQDVNARHMKPEMFDRLVKNIKADKRLESLPFCALVREASEDEDDNAKERIEIISGHHRIRAASNAGMKELFVIVDVTNMSKSKRKSKQLSHNSIAGEDDKSILARIYSEIEEAEDRLSAYVTEDYLQATTASISTNFNETMQCASFWFTKFDLERLERVYKVMSEKEVNFIAEIERFNDIQNKMKAAEKGYNIRAAGLLMARLVDLAMIDLKLEEPIKHEGYSSLLEALELCLIPKEAAVAIKNKMSKAAKKYSKEERYKALLDLLGVDVNNASDI